MRADGADRKRVALAGQEVPSRRALPGDVGEAGGRGLDALAFLVFSELADVFVLEAVRGDLVAVLQDRPHHGRIDVSDDGRDGEGGGHAEALEHRQEAPETDLGAELAGGCGEISGRDPRRSTGDAEVNNDNTGTLLTIWPAHLLIGQAFLV